MRDLNFDAILIVIDIRFREQDPHSHCTIGHGYRLENELGTFSQVRDANKLKRHVDADQLVYDSLRALMAIRTALHAFAVVWSLNSYVDDNVSGLMTYR